MPVELSHLMQLALGQRPHLPVGDLPRPVAEYLSCHPAIVFFGHNELHKVAKKHPEIKREEFQSLPFIIKDGRYIKDNSRPNCVTVFYQDPESGLYYAVGLKAADNGGEVWVSTFHRTTPKKAARREESNGFLYSSGPSHNR